MTSKFKTYEANAVNLFRTSSAAILSTVSKKHDGYPFGSFITYVSSRNRNIFLYASDIAEHTKNLRNNSKACMTLFKIDDDYDKQNSARLTLLGDLRSVPQEEVKSCEKRFHKFLPESKKYAAMHDFNFYQLEISEIRWIGGFGQIAWLDKEHWQKPEPSWLDKEPEMIEHMNQDHRNVIFSALAAQHKIRDEKALMCALSTDGYYVTANHKIYFIKFNEPCYSAGKYRKALVEQAKEFRMYESNDLKKKEATW